jgi:hypothetical protein
MRQTDIKTIYLTGEELKVAITDYITSRHAELAVLVSTHDVQLTLVEEGMIIRINREIEAYNDSAVPLAESAVDE